MIARQQKLQKVVAKPANAVIEKEVGALGVRRRLR
jgi:hypothetical protein